MLHPHDVDGFVCESLNPRTMIVTGVSGAVPDTTPSVRGRSTAPLTTGCGVQNVLV
jgi:hypothetical protein